MKNPDFSKEQQLQQKQVKLYTDSKPIKFSSTSSQLMASSTNSSVVQSNFTTFTNTSFSSDSNSLNKTQNYPIYPNHTHNFNNGVSHHGHHHNHHSNKSKDENNCDSLGNEIVHYVYSSVSSPDNSQIEKKSNKTNNFDGSLTLNIVKDNENVKIYNMNSENFNSHNTYNINTNKRLKATY